jgi:hypothetical protein
MALSVRRRLMMKVFIIALFALALTGCATSRPPVGNTIDPPLPTAKNACTTATDALNRVVSLNQKATDDAQAGDAAGVTQLLREEAPELRIASSAMSGYVDLSQALSQAATEVALASAAVERGDIRTTLGLLYDASGYMGVVTASMQYEGPCA